MLDRLQRRLTVLFSLLTAAVLAAALALTCRMAQSEYKAGADLLFANTVAAVEDAVPDGYFSHLLALADALLRVPLGLNASQTACQKY